MSKQKRVWIVVTVRRDNKGFVYNEGPFKTQREARDYAEYKRETEPSFLSEVFRYKIEEPYAPDRGWSDAETKE